MKKIWRKSLSILLLMITVFTGIPVAASEQILENDQEQIMPASPADDAEPLCTLIQEDSKGDDGIAMTSLDNSSNLRILNQRYDVYWNGNVLNSPSKTLNLAMGLKWIDNDGSNPDANGKWRMVYCLEWQKSSPSDNLIFNNKWTNRKVHYALYYGCMYWGETCRYPGYSANTGDWRDDYVVTQTAIHILNGEFSLATAKAAINHADPEAALAKNSGLSVLLKGVKSPSAATKNKVITAIEHIVNGANNSTNYTGWDSDGWFKLSNSTTTYDVSGYKDTWSKSTDGNYYSGGAFHITFNSYYGYDMRDQIDTVDISAPAGVKVHKKDNKTYSDFDVYISEKQYNDWSVTGKDIPITVKTSLRAWWGCAMYESKDTSLQPIGFITWTGTGGTYSVSKTITLHIPKDPTKSSKPVSVEVIKKDSLTGEALAGCDFTVYEYQPSTGNYVAKGKLGWDTTNKKYSSDANASLKEALKTNFQENGNQGKFKIVETSVPAGYTSSSAWSQVFSVSATDTSSTAKYSYNVTNDPTRILIKKVDEEGKAITGAHLEIYDSDNKKVAEFDSSADGNEIDRLVVGKTYILKETSVPPGYVKADNVSFLVQDTKEIQTVTMTDKWTKTEFAKISLADKKTVVPGASLELRKAKDIADSVVTTITGKKVQWVSGEDPEVFYGIQPSVYWLVETKSPSGYALSDPVQVTIEENLTNTVTMYDLPYTDLTVIKKIRADHINFANGNPTFVITVKGNDLLGNSHEYSEFYEFTKEYVQQHTESDGYVSVKYTWKGIPAGNAYEVTENDVNRYYLSQVTSADENVSIERLQESAYGVRPEDTFRVIADLQSRITGTTITFENEKYTWDDWSHNAIVKNTIQIIQSR